MEVSIIDNEVKEKVKCKLCGCLFDVNDTTKDIPVDSVLKIRLFECLVCKEIKAKEKVKFDKHIYV